MIELNMAKFNVKNPQTGEYEPLDGASQAKIQSDWNQTDNSAEDFIKNKPVLYTKAQTDTLLDRKVDKENGKGLSTNDFTDAYKTAIDGAASQSTTYTKSETDTLLSGKVNAIDGKGLSTNDFTTTEKNKLSGIESGAEVNVQVDWNQLDSAADDYIKNKPAIPTVNDATLTIQKNGTAVGTFSANAATAATINITVPVDADDVSALPDTTKYGASLSLSIDSTTYVVTASLKDQNGNTLGTEQTIDLPIETVVIGGSYDDITKKVILTLKNGNTIDFSVADLVAGLQTEITSTNKLDADLVDDTTSVHKFVTMADKTTWNAKSDFSGSYNDLTDKPTIPAPVTVDQTYNAQSANAQSGVAIEGKKPGLKTTGTEYTIDGQTVTASTGAEVFNDLTGNVASGDYSHAEGHNTRASSYYSHAEGSGTTASGNHSHAEGNSTTASSAASHAEGIYTTASGGYSHAEGYDTIASGAVSHAEGQGTKALSNHQHVQGKFNVEDANGTYAFIIGNGTSSARHNAFAVDWNGLIYVNGAATGVDVSAFPSPADINIAITKANAAAPQATTYTKNEVDTVLDEKLNISDVDDALSGISANPVQNKAIQAPLARLVDAEAKNLLKITATSQTVNGVTFTVNDDGTITADGTAIDNDAKFIVSDQNFENLVQARTFLFGSGCPTGGSDTTYFITFTYLSKDFGDGTGYRQYPFNTSNTNVFIIVRKGCTVNNLIFKPMLCKREDHKISPEFVPYAPTNRELYEMIGDINTVLEEVL